jgi:hypothetical protein
MKDSGLYGLLAWRPAWGIEHARILVLLPLVKFHFISLVNGGDGPSRAARPPRTANFAPDSPGTDADFLFYMFKYNILHVAS